MLARATYFPCGRGAGRVADLGLTAVARSLGDGQAELTLESRRYACAVRIDVAGHDPADNYVDVTPDDPQVILLRQRSGSAALTGTVQALNGESPVRILSPA